MLILLNNGAVIHPVARQSQSDPPSVFDQIGAIADRVRKPTERAWIPVPANSVFHGGVTLHTAQLLINQFFVRMKSGLVIRRKIRAYLTRFSVLLLHMNIPPAYAWHSQWARNGRRVPFSICQLKFDIGHRRRRSRFNTRSTLSDFRAMTNDKSQMENGKCFSIPIWRFTDCAPRAARRPLPPPL